MYILIGRKDWVKDLFDRLVANHKGQALYQPHTVYFKCRKMQRVAKPELRITQHLEGKVQALRHLLLIAGCLGAEAKQVCMECDELFEVIPKTTRLRCAPTSAGNQVPAARQRLPWNS